MKYSGKYRADLHGGKIAEFVVDNGEVKFMERAIDHFMLDYILKLNYIELDPCSIMSHGFRVFRL